MSECPSTSCKWNTSPPFSAQAVANECLRRRADVAFLKSGTVGDLLDDGPNRLGRYALLTNAPEQGSVLLLDGPLVGAIDMPL